jgi:hypothetical protein
MISLRAATLRSRCVRAIIALFIGVVMLSSAALPSFAAGGLSGNLSGTITDAATNQPAVNATVTAVAPTGKYTAHTDAHGHFSILGMAVDTYTVTVMIPGFQNFELGGVTIQGDQTVSIGSIAMTHTPRVIGGVRSHSASSVFQPSQTTDSFTISGERALQTLGKSFNTNENDLLLAVPGVTLSDTGTATIRGGLTTEVGYQLDGVNFTEPFFSSNASQGRFAGLGSLQVVEGAGDATQGDIGRGVINIVPKRGTNPAFGQIDLEDGFPNKDQQAGIEYGWASKDGRFSDYITAINYNQSPYNGYSNANAAAYGNYFGISNQLSNQFLNNFTFRFGKDNNQSLQVLYMYQNLRDYGNYGGSQGLSYYPGAPYAYNPVAGLVDNGDGTPNDPGYGPGTYGRLVGLNPDVPSNYLAQGAQEIAADPTRFLKLEYDNNLNDSTFLRVSYYNWETLQTGSNDLGSNAIASGLALGSYPTEDVEGGPRVGVTADLTKQFGEKNTVTIATKYETSHPIWDGYDPNAMMYLLGAGGPLADAQAPAGTPTLSDFMPGGYLSQYFPNGVPQVPLSGINYNGAYFQEFGIGLRWQWNPSPKWKTDLGVRYDGQNQHWGSNPFNTNPLDVNNPSDVNPSGLANQYVQPRETEPRAAVTYLMDPNDSLRFGYGRSVVFLNAQTAGTPAGLYNAAPFMNIPAQQGAMCGSGTNPKGFYPCANYAQELYWLYDQNFDAPDLGAALPATYSNYDFTYQHQFSNGMALHVTPFYALDTNTPSFALVRSLSTGSFVFSVNNQGINRTTGVEFGLSTRDVPVGASGFLSATYQNVLGSTPPLGQDEDSLPVNGSGSLELGDMYREGYVSPLDLRIGGDYKFKDGFRVSPVVEITAGYPYNVGTMVASSATINGQFANVPQVNYGAGTTQIPGFEYSSGPSNATQYYDPAYAGNSYDPNVAATRGTPSSASSGGQLWKPNVELNLTLEYKHKRNTWGVQFQNLFGNAYNGAIPIVNPYYQPVANGLSGPQTGVNPYVANSPAFANVPGDAYAFKNGAYLLLPLRPMTTTVYYQLSL